MSERRGPTRAHPSDLIPKVVEGATGAQTVDFEFNYSVHWHFKLTGNITITFQNVPEGGVFHGIFEQDATGGRTVTWPSGTRAQNALTAAANAVATFVMAMLNGTFYEYAYTGDIP